MKIEVRGQSFKIDLVSNWVRKRYTEMVELSAQLQELSFTISGIVGELKDVTEREQLDSIQERAESIKGKISEKSQELAEIRDDILRELLESNDLDYVSDWWDKKTGPEDVNDFLLTCLNKDFTPGKESSVKKK